MVASVHIPRRRFLAAAAALPLSARANRLSIPILALIVRAPRGASVGTLECNGVKYPCALGRSGIVDNKREGDGGTPAGVYPLRTVLYRPDRMPPPPTRLSTNPIAPEDGWCDAPADPAYNVPVKLPYRASAERMWRDDHAYDLLAVIGYNANPPVPGKGSAIFLHILRTAVDGAFLPTSGCIALRQADLQAVLAQADPRTVIDIAAI